MLSNSNEITKTNLQRKKKLQTITKPKFNLQRIYN